jgi:hypothetical protein
METAPARINLNFLNEATSMMISSVVKTSGMVEKKLYLERYFHLLYHGLLLGTWPRWAVVSWW